MEASTTSLTYDSVEVVHKLPGFEPVTVATVLAQLFSNVGQQNGKRTFEAMTAVIYRPVSGTYKITSHKEGNPATRHTEGEFNFVVVNPYNLSDTVRITVGKFYVNNY